jgi:hypothetical protein
MMTVKTLVAALALTTLPALAMAECTWGKQHQAQSCAAGTTWDATAGACVEIVNS